MKTQEIKTRKWYLEKAKLFFSLAQSYYLFKDAVNEERCFETYSILLKHALFCTVEDAKFTEL